MLAPLLSRRSLVCAALTAAAALLPGTPAFAQDLDPERLDALRYRHIGPDGNRAIAVVGEPGNPLVIYVGAASGGIWKTEDGGVNWSPLFDDQEASSISALAMAPSESNVLWAGTGETFVIRPAHAMGDGIYRSTDSGKTWTHMGLEDTGRIGRIRVHPTDSDIVYACALGHAYGPQAERGVYRTVDGGTTWELVLHISEDSGCIDLDLDPNNPRVLFASFWDIQIDTWGLDSGGPDSGVWRSTDSGDTWERLDHSGTGLPEDPDQHIGKVAVQIARSDSDVVYVLTEEVSPGFYRSDDGGDTWRLTLRNHTINERAPYYTRFEIDPEDVDRIYFASVRFSMSIDGGESIVDNPPRGGGDTHDIWIDPTDNDRIMVADDGGLTISLNRGRTFDRIVLPIAQMYHVAVDDEIPYRVYGNRQDGWSYRGPSNSLQGAIPLGLWQSVGGCESGFGLPDPRDSEIVWSGCYDGGLERYDGHTGHVRSVRVWPEAAYGWAPEDLRFRWHWTFPIVVSEHRPQVYVGSQFVHRSRDEGHSWEIISPDLTKNDKSHQRSSGGVAIDNLMTFDGATLFAIAESPLDENLLWVGSNDGLLHLTRDGGANWTNVTANVPDLPEWATIAMIEPSRYQAGTAYIAVDNHQQADFDPYLYRTTDFGASWTRISDGIERSVHSFAHVIREDPRRPGMLYAGTDNAVWMSLDDGASWTKLRLNMPPGPVYWIEIQERFDDLVVGTYGRGFWILDDIGPLRKLDAETMDTAFRPIAPRPTYRFNAVQGIKAERSHVTGRNPPTGAALTWWVGDQEGGGVRIQIEDASGDTIRTLRGGADPGLNRIWWDLRYEPTRQPRLRTPPPGMDWVPLGPSGWRPLRTWDLDLFRGQLGPRVVPGTYTVRFVRGDQEQTMPLEVLQDPASTGSVADMQAQLDLGLVLRDEINDIVDMVNDLEWTRKQLDDLQQRLSEGEPGEAEREAIQESERLERLAIEAEDRLFDIYLTGAREDAFRNPMKLYGRYSALSQDVSFSSADHPPTVPQEEVHGVLQERLDDARGRYRRLYESDADALNELLRQLKLPIVISHAETTAPAAGASETEERDRGAAVPSGERSPNLQENP